MNHGSKFGMQAGAYIHPWHYLVVNIGTDSQRSEDFNIGIVYRPTFYRPDLINKFKYEHLISIDFAWKIRLMK